jgi:hypothetical protein
MINLSAMPLSHPWVQSKGSFRSFRKRYANQRVRCTPKKDSKTPDCLLRRSTCTRRHSPLSAVLLSHPRGALQGEFPQFPQALRQSPCSGEALGQAGRPDGRTVPPSTQPLKFAAARREPRFDSRRDVDDHLPPHRMRRRDVARPAKSRRRWQTRNPIVAAQNRCWGLGLR